jgi:hypothetical protein
VTVNDLERYQVINISDTDELFVYYLTSHLYQLSKSFRIETVCCYIVFSASEQLYCKDKAITMLAKYVKRVLGIKCAKYLVSHLTWNPT